MNKDFDNLTKRTDLNPDDYMFMGIAHVHKTIHMYKNINTRRYINIDNLGSFFLYNGKGYTKISKETAIAHVEG